MSQAPAKKSDLGVRVASAVVMVTVAGTALWLGGWWWTAFVAAVALGVLWEWWGLVTAFAKEPFSKLVWILAGLLYVVTAAGYLIELRQDWEGLYGTAKLLLTIIAVDVGAYFAGRSIGGPKIAPAISPSKTWAGLVGGIIAASAMILLLSWASTPALCEFLDPMPEGLVMFDGTCSAFLPPMPYLILQPLVGGMIIAVVAQAGDFFESWIKRKARVKDSSRLIPGHGGLFDRVDGLLAVSFFAAVLQFTTIIWHARQ